MLRAKLVHSLSNGAQLGISQAATMRPQTPAIYTASTKSTPHDHTSHTAAITLVGATNHCLLQIARPVGQGNLDLAARGGHHRTY